MWHGIKREVEYLVNVMWPLTPCSRDNGATLFWPTAMAWRRSRRATRRAAGAVRLHSRLAGIESAQARMRTLHRWLDLAVLGDFSAKLFPREVRAVRWAQASRVHDALVAGVTQREIAATLFGKLAADRRWSVEAAPYRLRVQRLVIAARRQAAAGPLAWVRRTRLAVPLANNCAWEARHMHLWTIAARMNKLDQS